MAFEFFTDDALQTQVDSTASLDHLVGVEATTFWDPLRITKGGRYG
jgi:hypothetical protein